MQTAQATSREPRGVDLTERIVEAVADAEGVRPAELNSCLYDVVNPDALNALFRRPEGDSATAGRVSFRFHGYEVTVRSDSTVDIE